MIRIPIPGMMRNYMPFHYIPYTNNVIKDTLTAEQIKYIEDIIIAPYVKNLNDSIAKGIIPTITKNDIKKLVLADLPKILSSDDIKKQCTAINLKLQEELSALKIQLSTLQPSIDSIKIESDQYKINTDKMITTYNDRVKNVDEKLLQTQTANDIVIKGVGEKIQTLNSNLISLNTTNETNLETIKNSISTAQASNKLIQDESKKEIQLLNTKIDKLTTVNPPQLNNNFIETIDKKLKNITISINGLIAQNKINIVQHTNTKLLDTIDKKQIETRLIKLEQNKPEQQRLQDEPIILDLTNKLAEINTFITNTNFQLKQVFASIGAMTSRIIVSNSFNDRNREIDNSNVNKLEKNILELQSKLKTLQVEKTNLPIILKPQVPMNNMNDIEEMKKSITQIKTQLVEIDDHMLINDTISTTVEKIAKEIAKLKSFDIKDVQVEIAKLQTEVEKIAKLNSPDKNLVQVEIAKMHTLIQQLNGTIAQNHMSAIQKNDLMPNLNAQIDKKIQHNKEEIYTMIEEDKTTKNKENNIFTQNINEKLEKLIGEMKTENNDKLQEIKIQYEGMILENTDILNRLKIVEERLTYLDNFKDELTKQFKDAITAIQTFIVDQNKQNEKITDDKIEKIKTQNETYQMSTKKPTDKMSIIELDIKDLKDMYMDLLAKDTTAINTQNINMVETKLTTMIDKITPLINKNNKNILTKLYGLIENINSVYKLYDENKNTNAIKKILETKQDNLVKLLNEISKENEGSD